MTVEKKETGDITELKLKGWLDTQNAPVLEETMAALDGGTRELVFDCAELEYISSSGLRQFVGAHKRMNGAVTLRNVSARIMDVLAMTGLDKTLKIEKG